MVSKEKVSILCLKCLLFFYSILVFPHPSQDPPPNTFSYSASCTNLAALIKKLTSYPEDYLALNQIRFDSIYKATSADAEQNIIPIVAKLREMQGEQNDFLVVKFTFNKEIPLDHTRGPSNTPHNRIRSDATDLNKNLGTVGLDSELRMDSLEDFETTMRRLEVEQPKNPWALQASVEVLIKSSDDIDALEELMKRKDLYIRFPDITTISSRSVNEEITRLKSKIAKTRERIKFLRRHFDAIPEHFKDTPLPSPNQTISERDRLLTIENRMALDLPETSMDSAPGSKKELLRIKISAEESAISAMEREIQRIKQQ